jgi:hypothetical protein
MAAELLLGECIYCIVGLVIILAVTCIFFKESTASWTAGFIEGVIMAAAIMIHIAVSVEDSVVMLEDEALKHTRINYIIRMAVALVVFLLIVFFKLGDIIAVLFGLMSLKVSAYIQPFTHKIYEKFISEGR